MANDKIDIANMALLLINEPEIQTIENPTDKNEKIVSRFIDEVIEEFCSSRAWNFCTKVEQLAEDVGNDSDYSYRYVLPNVPKTLRVLGFKNKYGSFDPEWERRGDKIVTNENPAFMEIIFKPDLISTIPAYAIRAIVTLLAGRIAVPVLGIDGGKLSQIYEQEYAQVTYPNAVMLDNQEGHKSIEERSSLLGGMVIDGDFVGDTYPLSYFGVE